MKRLLALTLVAAAAALAVGPAAMAGPIDDAATTLRRDPVFVHPDAERRLEQDEADRLRTRITQSGAPVFIAMLPSSASPSGDVDRLPAAVGEAVGLRGTYAVVAGNSFRAASNALPSGRASSLATASFQAARDGGTLAVLEDFVDRVAAATESSGAPSSGGSGGGGATERPRGGAFDTEQPRRQGSGMLPFLLLLGLGGGGLWLMSRNRRQRQDELEDYTADREMVRAELSVLADDVLRMEQQVVLKPDARPDYDAAVHRYQVAQAAFESGDDRVDMLRVRRLVDEGRYAMDRAKAIVDGRQPPLPPAELQQPGRRGEPPIEIDDQRRPRYQGYDDGYGGGGWYGGGGGWFGGGGGGLFTGLLLGQMLGGFGGWGHGHGDTIIVNNDNGDGGSWDSGGGSWDSGGGDWGGGGDFGGGDVGGDW